MPYHTVHNDPNQPGEIWAAKSGQTNKHRGGGDSKDMNAHSEGVKVAKLLGCSVGGSGRGVTVD